MNTVFKKEKIIAFLSVISMSVLCLQHFWGIFAENIQVSYVPMIITFVTIAVNEADSAYDKKKEIIIPAAIASIMLFVIGVSVVTAGGYGIEIEHKFLIKGIYIAITILALILAIFEIKKLVKV